MMQRLSRKRQSGSRRRRSNGRQRGFTLMEMIVAIAIFALIATMAYGALNRFINHRERLSVRNELLSDLQKTFALMERDFRFATTRPIRDEVGSLEAAFTVKNSDSLAPGEKIRLTTSLPTPPSLDPDDAPSKLQSSRERKNKSSSLRKKGAADDKRTSQQLTRVAWRVEDGDLIRVNWEVLDRDADSKEYRRRVLKGVVEDLEVKALVYDYDALKVTSRSAWPNPTELQGVPELWEDSTGWGGYEHEGAPDGVEVVMKIEGGHTYTRVFELNAAAQEWDLPPSQFGGNNQQNPNQNTSQPQNPNQNPNQNQNLTSTNPPSGSLNESVESVNFGGSSGRTLSGSISSSDQFADSGGQISEGAPGYTQTDAYNPNDPYNDPYNADNQYDPNDPYNPDNQYDPNDPYNPDNQYDPNDPYNPDNQYDPNDPYNPDNQYDPNDPYNPDNQYDPNTSDSYDDLDGDGLPDEDINGDGIADFDMDGDGIPDIDTNGDGQPDIDLNGDGIPEIDLDGDGLPDIDENGDGLPDSDFDGDGIPDIDLDGDGQPDIDLNGDGIPDDPNNDGSHNEPGVDGEQFQEEPPLGQENSG